MDQPGAPDRDLDLVSFVRERRRIASLTQHELGDLAGVGKRFIVELEGGKSTLRLDKVNLVLAVFGRRLGPVIAAREEGTTSTLTRDVPVDIERGTTT
jgi:y4mF family transcriptional regulator